MTDQLQELFAAARTRALAEVRPPGAAVARRIVRRRRIGTSVAAAVALVSVAAAVVLVDRRDDSLPAARPAAPASDLSGWANTVSLAVGVDHTRGPGEVLTSTGAEKMRTVEATFGGGTYDLMAACAGRGVVTFVFELGAAGVETVPVPCSSPVRPVRTWVTVPESLGTIQVIATPDATAAGWAAVAFQMKLSDTDRNRLTGVAVAALPGDSGSVAGSGLLPDGFRAEDRTVRPGRYRAWFSCFGTGTVRLTVDLATDEEKPAQSLGQAELTCGPSAPSGSIPFTVPSPKPDAVDLTLTPDPSATGAAAFRLERL